MPAANIPGSAARVFNQLVQQTDSGASKEAISWELRLVKGGTGNAFSLPDGAVYVDQELSLSLANDPGLWAAVLAHEIIHVTQHHWMKQAAFRESLRDLRLGLGFIQLGGSLTDLPLSIHADRDHEIADFSQELEVEADVGSLSLMARAGFHPDFVTALCHLMQAQERSSVAAHFLTSHPAWDVRESHLRKRYSAALAEFERLWPRASDSPGGNPPVLAFLGRPEARPDADHAGAEVTLPIRCENTTDRVDVLLLIRRLKAADAPAVGQADKIRQTIDCHSGWTTARFMLGATDMNEADAEFLVMDGRGWVLGRTAKMSMP